MLILFENTDTIYILSYTFFCLCLQVGKNVSQFENVFIRSTLTSVRFVCLFDIHFIILNRI
jgi:hypothetical protein